MKKATAQLRPGTSYFARLLCLLCEMWGTAGPSATLRSGRDDKINGKRQTHGLVDMTNDGS